MRCVLPAVEHRPRWARRLIGSGGSPTGKSTSPSLAGGLAPDHILERLKVLESLVQDLRAELELSRDASTTGASHTRSDDGPPAEPVEQAPQVPSNRRGDLSSRFWSGVDLELAEFRHETNQDEADEHERTTGELSPTIATMSTFGANHTHGIGRALLPTNIPASYSDDTSRLLPMVSQMPFLLDIYAERVHSIICIPHLPSLQALFRQHRTTTNPKLTADEDALIFATLYAAICSLDDEEVHASFNQPKAGLASNYRKGLEISLAKADFLANPSHELVQALLIFLTLARLQDSPKYLWMMTGIVIRMARFLRCHQDGSESKEVTPFQAEIQRRVWWNLCALDMRATEDQGTELTNPDGSFTTALPSNVDDADLWPEMEHTPPERSRLTNVSLLRLCSKVARCTQKMMAIGGAAAVDDHGQLIESVTQELDRDYFSVTDPSQHHAYLAAAGTMRIFLARLTLLAFLPALLSSPDANVSTEIRNKMLIAGIEIAELNHALNTEPSCQPWRWVYQTQQHWHAVVYLLIDICRRPWSATVERAWLALQSPWLLPARASSYRNPTVWVPLKKLMNRARSHREEELSRLRHDLEEARRLEREDQKHISVPSSSTTFPMYYNEEMFRKRWNQLLTSGTGENTDDSSASNAMSTTAAKTAQASGAADARNQRPATGFMAQGDSFQHSENSDGRHISSTEQSIGAGMDTSDLSNLDTFLGADITMNSLDDMEDVDFLNFDWNAWFSSANSGL